MSKNSLFTDDSYKGVSTASFLSAKWNKDTNKWDIESTITQKRSKDLEEWEQKNATIQISDNDISHGLSEVLLTLNLYMEKVNGDLFSEIEKEELLQ